MWIITRDGFFSVVEMRDSDGKFVLVRTRLKAHATALTLALDPPAKARKIIDMPSADYRFRVVLPREAWKEYLLLAADDITYDSHFKEAVRDAQPKRHRAAMYGAMLRIWVTLADLQPTRPYAGRTKALRRTT